MREVSEAHEAAVLTRFIASPSGQVKRVRSGGEPCEARVAGQNTQKVVTTTTTFILRTPVMWFLELKTEAQICTTLFNGSRTDDVHTYRILR